MNNPCINCTKRCTNCHSKCDEYKSFLDDLHKRKEWLKEKNKSKCISDAYLSRMIKADHHANKCGLRSYGRRI